MMNTIMLLAGEQSVVNEDMTIISTIVVLLIGAGVLLKRKWKANV